MDFNHAFLEHFKNPQNVGEIESADGMGMAGSRECGDLIQIFLKIKGKHITNARFKAYGCPGAIAASSITTQLIQGRTLDEAAMLTPNKVERALGSLPKSKKHGLNLSVQALGAALEDFLSRNFSKTQTVSPRRVAVAMSGGVDSSTSAFLLKEAGYEVIGLTMRLYDLPRGKLTQPTCCAPRDIADARKVAEQIGFPHYTIDLKEEFLKRVIEPFAKTYRMGQTPNPCMECNRQIKFKTLLGKAEKLGAGFLATGHYVQIKFDKNLQRYLVYRAKDKKKDQSYMFWAATQKVLSKLLTPLGFQDKTKTRRQAKGIKLVVAEKEDSQEICFIPDNDYHRFLIKQGKYQPCPGPIVNSKGKIIGKHKGLAFYTIGQRRGLQIAHLEPLYVLKINSQDNILVVGTKDELKQEKLLVSEVNFIPFDNLKKPLEVEAVVRYKMQPVPATIYPLDHDKVKVLFSQPVSGIAPGQSAAFYQDDALIGGGIIEKY